MGQPRLTASVTRPPVRPRMLQAAKPVFSLLFSVVLEFVFHKNVHPRMLFFQLLFKNTLKFSVLISVSVKSNGSVPIGKVLAFGHPLCLIATLHVHSLHLGLTFTGLQKVSNS